MLTVAKTAANAMVPQSDAYRQETTPRNYPRVFDNLYLYDSSNANRQMIRNSFCDKPKSILYQNEAKNITLIDVPQSIADAQGNWRHNQSRLIQSCDPQTKPHASCEPKPGKGKNSKGFDQGKDASHHNHVASVIVAALEEVKREYSGKWHLQRYVEQSKARKDFSVNDASSIYGKTIRNDSNSPSYLPAWVIKRSITIPPHSSFVLGEVQEICQFNLHLAPGSLVQPSYDFILMDPPWPNASAKRRSAYKQSSPEGVKNMLLDIPVPEMLAKEGRVGVWITNRSSFYDLVLGKDGLFEQWDIELFEEWIWVKTTIEGEPVIALDSIWRKPYEILLLGKRGPSPKIQPATRVIIGVPDIHSRKPCLKNLIEPLINDSKDCKVLEIFARYLVERWDSWGDEVFKFNLEEYWSTPNSTESTEYQDVSMDQGEPGSKRRRIVLNKDEFDRKESVLN